MSSVRETFDGSYVVIGSTNQSFASTRSDVYLVKTARETSLAEAPLSRRLFSTLESTAGPFTDRTSIGYQLRQRSNVRLTIYNLLGQKVRTLVDSEQDAGVHTAIWNARDDSGRRVSSGTYFLRLEAGNHTATRKLCVVR